MVIIKDSIFRFSAIAALTIMLVGCSGDDMSELQAYVDNAYRDQKPEIEALPEIPPFVPYEYQADPDTDPFGTGNVITNRESLDSDSSLRPDPNRRREPLEAFPLDGLRLVGTLARGATPWAVIQTSQGTAHTLQVGNYMGQNDGRIAEINLDRQSLTLVETVLSTSGKWEKREIELSLEE